MSLPAVSGKDVFKALKRNGYVEVPSAASSHRHLQHPDKGSKVTIPIHGNRDLPKGTLNSILNQAGITANELVAML